MTMGAVDDYIASLPLGAERSELTRLHRLVVARIRNVGQATSYGMPCYTYRGVPLAAIVIRKNHIAWYPYSGKVLPHLDKELTGYSRSPGTLRFTAATSLPDGLVAQLIDLRIREIDERAGT